jgi:hypothetical protein
MSLDALIAKKPAFITAHVQRFRETRSIRPLLRAGVLVLRQHRTLELLYGAYCSVFHKASKILPSEAEAVLLSILKQKGTLTHQDMLSRAQLIELYGSSFRVDLLPHDFRIARCESIWRQANDFLVIGEYGEGSRLAYVTSQTCVLGDHYRRVRGVRHIHSVEGYGDDGEFLVATGDTKKFLDVWTIKTGAPRFVRRLRRWVAGFTAAVKVNGQYYFGTDFSSRPNYIATLSGSKYFFPEKAYRMYVTAFHVFFDRFIVSVNHELRVVGGRKTLSIFDTALERFIYCDYWSEAEEGGAFRAA